MIHLDFVAVGGCTHDDEISGGRLDRDGAVLVDDRDRRLNTDVEAKFLLGLGHCPRGHGENHNHSEPGSLSTMIHKPFPQPWVCRRAESPVSASHYGRERSKAIS